MVTPGINDIILQTVQQERKTNQFRQCLERQLPRLRDKLILPDNEPVTVLIAFIIGYIKNVPDCLNLVAAIGRRLGFANYTAPFLDIAEDYFIHPPEELAGKEGLEALLDEAFLAHRLLEEINDHHFRQLQRSLLPLDMTEANVIVHHLLGEVLASLLERLVQFTASRMLAQEGAWQGLSSLPRSTELTDAILATKNLSRTPLQVRLRLAHSA